MEDEFYTKVSGVTFDCPHTGVPRQTIIRKYIRPGVELTPIREPDNEHSDTAVGLWLTHGRKDYHVGYLNPERSPGVYAAMQRHAAVKVVVTEVTGGTRQRPTRGVNLVVSVNDAERGIDRIVVAEERSWLRRHWLDIVVVAVIVVIVFGVLARGL